MEEQEQLQTMKSRPDRQVLPKKPRRDSIFAAPADLHLAHNGIFHTSQPRPLLLLQLAKGSRPIPILI